MNKKERLEALISYYSKGNKTAFASKLGIKPQSIHSWLIRDTFDIDLIYSKCDGISAYWLITGKGKMLAQNDSTNPTKNDMTQENFFDALKRRDRQFDELLEQNSRLISVIENMTGTAFKQTKAG